MKVHLKGYACSIGIMKSWKRKFDVNKWIFRRHLIVENTANVQHRCWQKIISSLTKLHSTLKKQFLICEMISNRIQLTTVCIRKSLGKIQCQEQWTSNLLGLTSSSMSSSKANFFLCNKIWAHGMPNIYLMYA